MFSFIYFLSCSLMSRHFIPLGHWKVMYFRSGVQVTSYPLRFIAWTNSSRLPTRFMVSLITTISWNFQLSFFCAARNSREERLAPSF